MSDRFILKEQYREPECCKTECDHYHSSYDRNVESHPERYGLTEVARFDWHTHSYEFDYTLVWKDEQGRVWEASDSGCSCPRPFEDTEELNRVTNTEELKERFRQGTTGQYFNCCHDPTAFGEFIRDVAAALA